MLLSRRLRHILSLLVVLLLAALLRGNYVVYLPGQDGDLLHSDMGSYTNSGWCMAKGSEVTGGLGFNGYHPLSASTYYYAGYTYFLAAIYRTWGYNHFAVRIVQGTISTVTVLMVYLVGRMVFGRRQGILAALLAACYLPLVYYAGLALTETWFIFLQMSALALWLLAWTRQPDPSGRPGANWIGLLFLLSGIATGMACITRAGFLPALGLLAVALLVLKRTELFSRRLVKTACFLVGAGLVIAPITIRNLQIHGRLILISTNGPTTFYTAHVSHGHMPEKSDMLKTDAQMAEQHRRMSWQYLRRNWPAYLAEVPEFFVRIWTSDEFWPNTTSTLRYAEDPVAPYRMRVAMDSPGGPPFAMITHFPDLMRYVDRVIWLMIGLPFGLAAVLCLPRDHNKWLFVYLMLIPYLVIPFLASAYPRYRLPAVPLMFILAAQTLCSLWEFRRQQLGSDSKATIPVNP